MELAAKDKPNNFDARYKALEPYPPFQELVENTVKNYQPSMYHNLPLKVFLDKILHFMENPTNLSAPYDIVKGDQLPVKDIDFEGVFNYFFNLVS